MSEHRAGLKYPIPHTELCKCNTALRLVKGPARQSLSEKSDHDGHKGYFNGFGKDIGEDNSVSRSEVAIGPNTSSPALSKQSNDQKDAREDCGEDGKDDQSEGEPGAAAFVEWPGGRACPWRMKAY